MQKLNGLVIIMGEEYIINSPEETEKLAKKIANIIRVGQVIELKGNLGAGKTYFTNCLINTIYSKYGLGSVAVSSPTFNIVKEYQVEDFSIYHFDLYRLKDKNELYELDIENAFENGISIIEWPEIAEDLIYNVAIKISIEITGESSRLFKINLIN